MLLQFLYILAITAEAISGALAAGRHKMDLFGVMLISLVTAIGGGTLRDVLLNMHPVTWISHPKYIVLLCAFSLLTALIPYFMVRLDRLFLVLDAVGLVTFSIIGVNKALSFGFGDKEFGIVICVIAGVITGVTGGIMRDILCNKIPLIFHKELYASISIACCVLYFILVQYTPLPHVFAVISTLLFGFAFRILAIYFKVGLPIFHLK